MATTYSADAALYDIAYSADPSTVVEWLIERLGRPELLLEPACGSARMFPAFAERGVRVAGIEQAPMMVERARRRLSSDGVDGLIVEGDMADFDVRDLVGRPFDGAYCPINTFSYLNTDDEARQHLEAVARHLRPGGRYIMQFDIIDPSPDRALTKDFIWEREVDGVRVRTTWGGRSYDPDTRIETQSSRFEVLSGPDEGRVAEDEHSMRLWDWKSWTELVDTSPFTLVASYSGDHEDTPQRLPDGEVEPAYSVWHELALDG